MSFNNTPIFILFLALTQGVGLVSSLFTRSSVSTWYVGLRKPSFNPPAWVFAPVWTLLYALMAWAAFRVWRSGWERGEVKTALAWFAGQLLVNGLWSVVFFGRQSPRLALLVIGLLWLLLVVTLLKFGAIDKLAAYLWLPYLFWVTFAAILNFSMVSLN